MRLPRAHRRSQATVEVIILVALVGLGVAWVASKLPKAITFHYKENQKVVASPL